MPEQFVYTGNHVSISDYSMDSKGFRGVCAEADRVGDVWWIARVLVRREEDRGKGLGSKCLQKLLSEIYLHEGGPLNDVGATIIVSPGGYGADSTRQERFYRKNGFVERKTEDGFIFVHERKKSHNLLMKECIHRHLYST